MPLRFEYFFVKSFFVDTKYGNTTQCHSNFSYALQFLTSVILYEQPPQTQFFREEYILFTGVLCRQRHLATFQARAVEEGPSRATG